MSTLERKSFKEVFSEDKKTHSLKLLLKLKIKDKEYPVDTEVTIDEGLNGVDFHQFRYFDVAIEKEDGSDAYTIKGFYVVGNPSK